MQKNMETNINTRPSNYATMSLSLPREAIEEFQQIYLQKYHKQITFNESSLNGLRLVKKVLPVYKPIPNTKKGDRNE